MTRQKTFKQKIRSRMAETGERYAAARLSLLKDRGDVHSPTARLVEVTAGLTEAEMFVASGGTGFMYFLAEYQGTGPLLTMVCRSWSMPGLLIERALENASVEHEVFETGSANKAQKDLDAVLDEGRAAIALVDETALPWRGMPAKWRGYQPRAVVVKSRAGDGYQVSDGRVREMSRAALADARAAIKKQKHKLYVATGKAKKPGVLERALPVVKQGYLESPKKGFESNFGLKGLDKAASLMSGTGAKSWSKVFDDRTACAPRAFAHVVLSDTRVHAARGRSAAFCRGASFSPREGVARPRGGSERRAVRVAR